MQIENYGQRMKVELSLRDHLERRFLFALSRFAAKIEKVELTCSRFPKGLPMRLNLSLIAVIVVGIVAVSLSASAVERVRTRGFVQAGPTTSVVAQKEVVAAQDAEPSLAELRARITQLSKQVEQLEADAAESRRQIISLTNQMKGRAPAAPIAQPVLRHRVVEPVTTYPTDLFPNEYPYGG